MGSVDRNPLWICIFGKELLSLPAWGAWIEIELVKVGESSLYVAPRMGSVDRNLLLVILGFVRMGRSPHGERG